MEPMKLGVVGCGDVSDWYFRALAGFAAVKPVCCCDRDPARAAAQAAKHGLRAVAWDEMLADPGVEMVVNLTNPQAHAAITRRALGAGKHVHSEKPLGVSRAETRELFDLADARGLRLSGAPDVFLGGLQQTARALVDAGDIGEPFAAAGTFVCGGYERGYRGDPTFFYKPGGGPMLDLGGYYVTAWVNLFGPVRRVMAATRLPRRERVVPAGPAAGRVIGVEVDTHATAILEFDSGPVATLTLSFDVPATAHPPFMHVYGRDGTLAMTPPFDFFGTLRRSRAGAEAWDAVEIGRPYAAERCHGIGAADSASGLANGRPARAGAGLIEHVMDVLFAIDESARRGERVEPASRCDRPAPLPAGLPVGRLD